MGTLQGYPQSHQGARLVEGVVQRWGSQRGILEGENHTRESWRAGDLFARAQGMNCCVCGVSGDGTC